MLILASSSRTRAAMLKNAGVVLQTDAARVDEEALRQSMDGEPARDIADALAELKARKVALRNQGRMVLGSDQVLAFDGRLLGKAGSEEELKAQLRTLSGRAHELFSAAVLYDDGRPVWRFVGRAKLHMRSLSEPFIANYVRRNWEDIRHSVGGYHIEGEGARLFTRIEGDHFSILGLPLLEVLTYLGTRGVIET